jgi:UDP-GlcNAc:undecaprenyl-phosphate GlcNAc-1-phosphate transferase
MLDLLLLKFLYCFGLTNLLVLLLHPVAEKLGWHDHPGEHKTHEHSTPLTGGVAIYIAMLVMVFYTVEDYQDYAVLNYTALALLIFGFIDDKWFLSATSRFVVEIIGFLVMIFLGGVALHDFGELMWNGTLSLGFLWVPITVFAALGVINAYNMIDGLDGLAGSIFVVAAGGMAYLAFQAGNLQSFELLMLAVSAVAGFLLFNARFPWNKKGRLFLGDSGSRLLGFFLAWQFIDLGSDIDRVYAPITAIWLLAIPLMDTCYLIGKRWRAGQSPFEADQGHLHHAFLKAGFSVTATWLSISALAIAFAAFGIYTELQQWPEYWRFYIFIGLSVGYVLVMNSAWRNNRFLGRKFISE